MTPKEPGTGGKVRGLLARVRGRLGERQLRLFACACCRRIGRWIADDRIWQALVVSERFADGLASADELAAARYDALRACDQPWLVTLAATAAAFPPDPDGRSDPMRSVKAAAAATRSFWAQAGGSEEAEDEAQAHLLLDIVGGSPPGGPRAVPFGPPGCPDAVLSLAQSLYANYALADLSPLADLLDGKGGVDPALLAHCRAPGRHVRGCWALDRLLGRS
jgi:hypothetical protein